MTERLCGAVVEKRWKAPDYRERETIGTGLCWHPESRHEYVICYDCDAAGNTAGMTHDFVPVILTASTLLPEET